jgi:hypothetical protein
VLRETAALEGTVALRICRSGRIADFVNYFPVAKLVLRLIDRLGVPPPRPPQSKHDVFPPCEQWRTEKDGWRQVMTFSQATRTIKYRLRGLRHN